MPSPRGIFRLKQVYEEQLSNNWSVKSDVWLSTPQGTINFGTGTVATPNTGYFGGGNPGPYSTVDRIDYSNDTATAVAKGPLSVGRYFLAATGNNSYGYFGGGLSAATVSTVDRIDYANDTATASPKGPLSTPVYGNSGFSPVANGL